VDDDTGGLAQAFEAPADALERGQAPRDDRRILADLQRSGGDGERVRDVVPAGRPEANSDEVAAAARRNPHVGTVGTHLPDRRSERDRTVVRVALDRDG